MRKIAALLVSSLALLSVGSATAADRWGWSDITGPGLSQTAGAGSWAPIGILGQSLAHAAADVKVVQLPLGGEPPAVAGSIAGALPHLQDAVAAVRTAVAEDPLLRTNLEAQGFRPEQVIGLSRSATGGVTVFVTSNA
ncbi:MAG TPA: hypothetical protein VFE52_06055 [Devosia sp.]|jgi:hypothetical protein|nr:hypothetical protein [Devosia sp.]